MGKLKHSKIGVISFLLTLIPIIFVVIQTFIDFSTPVNAGFNKEVVTSLYFIINIMFAISLVSFVLGIVALTRKGYKKRLPISAVIISGLILSIPVIG